MKLKHNLAFTLLVSLLLTGCITDTGDPSTAQNGPPEISCEVFYRSGPGQPLEEAPGITFTSDTNKQRVLFENMHFEGQFQDDAYEGRSLLISVTIPDTGKEITRQLYQFDNNPVENQFIGGHGFTGLVYVYHPESNSEMQYFCSVK